MPQSNNFPQYVVGTVEVSKVYAGSTIIVAPNWPLELLVCFDDLYMKIRDGRIKNQMFLFKFLYLWGGHGPRAVYEIVKEISSCLDYVNAERLISDSVHT